MGRFISEPDLIKKFGAKSTEIIASYTPERTAAVLASLAIECDSKGTRRHQNEIH